MTPWWTPDRHADRRPLLTARTRIKAALRSDLATAGYTEVETACLQVSPGNEAHLHAFRTEAIGTDLSRAPLYLHTSPEFAMKKLLAAGETRIFSFASVFRNRERGPLHSPEFTMLEWYEAGAPYTRVQEQAARMLSRACTATGMKAVTWKGRSADPHAEPERLSVAEAFVKYADIDLFSTLSADGTPDRTVLAEQAASRGHRIADSESWPDIFSKVLTRDIEPNLGTGRPTLLVEYPACEAALARRTPHDPRVSERFELYVCGVELANGFGELTDPAEQRRRFEGEMAEKLRIYGERYPIDEDFLAALALMPPASGCALGFDRLVMLATGATHVDQVLWTPLHGGSM